MSELYTVISATNRANSNTLKVAKQYEQLLRAVFGLALGDTTTTFPSAMVNILGRAETGSTLQQSVASLLTLKGVHIHWYAKKEKHGRKLGHVTIKDHSLESVLATADSVRTILNN